MNYHFDWTELLLPRATWMGICLSDAIPLKLTSNGIVNVHLNHLPSICWRFSLVIAKYHILYCLFNYIIIFDCWNPAKETLFTWGHPDWSQTFGWKCPKTLRAVDLLNTLSFPPLLCILTNDAKWATCNDKVPSWSCNVKMPGACVWSVGNDDCFPVAFLCWRWMTIPMWVFPKIVVPPNHPF